MKLAAPDPYTSKVEALLPTGLYTFFQFCTGYVSRDGACDATRRGFFWALYGVFTAFVAVFAVVGRHWDGFKDDSKENEVNWRPFFKKDGDRPVWWELLIDAIRAVGASSAFTVLALLTPPATTCLFPSSVAGSSTVPAYLVNALTTVGASFPPHMLPKVRAAPSAGGSPLPRPSAMTGGWMEAVEECGRLLLSAKCVRSTLNPSVLHPGHSNCGEPAASVRH
jgi:hypothetical protein